MTFEEKYKTALDIARSNLKSNANKNKPLIPHITRVGRYLYENGYSETIVNAGILRDVLEWTDNSERCIRGAFGDRIYNIVSANSKNKQIAAPKARREDYINRCAAVGTDALIVKAADVLDSFWYYQTMHNESEMERSRHIASLILNKIDKDEDPIFQELDKILRT